MDGSVHNRREPKVQEAGHFPARTICIQSGTGAVASTAEKTFTDMQLTIEEEEVHSFSRKQCRETDRVTKR